MTQDVSVVSAESPRHAEDELLLPPALRLPGRVRDARPPPGPAVPPPPPSSFHHLVGGSADQGLRPRVSRPHLPRRPPVDEKLRGAPELGGPLFPLPGVRQCLVGAGPVHSGGTVGMLLLGTGERMCCAVIPTKDDLFRA